jgi:RNA polymerase sigma-70 factor (ECF subfamily)
MEDSLSDGSCFAQVFARHADAIFRYAAIRIGPVHAEDVVAETFSTAFDRRDRFDRRATSARPWLYGIAANKLRKHGEAEQLWLKRAVAEPASVEVDETTHAEARIDAQRLRPELAAALLLLSPGERDVLLLHALEELTHDQVARVLGIRSGTAKTRLSRGRARIRALLESVDPRGEEGHDV